MSVTPPKALILAGDGINCEVETAHAFRLAKFEVEIRNLNDLAREHLSMDQISLKYAAIALPGGFSFGDDLSSGKVLALKLQHRLAWDLPAYAARGGLVIGICNGFQALIKMGIYGKDLSITGNSDGKFVDTWTRVTPSGSHCIWLKGLGSVDLPIRHGEGRIVIAAERHSETLDKLDRIGMTCLLYENNPNGSAENLAGLCDSTGRIFGLMPHPEGFVRWTSHPEWTSQPARASAPGQGLVLFENAYQEALRVQS